MALAAARTGFCFVLWGAGLWREGGGVISWMVEGGWVVRRFDRKWWRRSRRRARNRATAGSPGSGRRCCWCCARCCCCSCCSGRSTRSPEPTVDLKKKAKKKQNKYSSIPTTQLQSYLRKRNDANSVNRYSILMLRKTFLRQIMPFWLSDIS